MGMCKLCEAQFRGLKGDQIVSQVPWLWPAASNTAVPRLHAV